MNHVFRKLIEGYEGDLRVLESAIGFRFVGVSYGWRVMLLVHHKSTIKRYETILGIDVRQAFPEFGPLANRSKALNLAKKIGNYWKVVRGGIRREGLSAIVVKGEGSQP